jgi:hypothetical protein
LAAAESEIEKQTGVITDLNKRIDELQEQADEAAKLKDRVDEWVLVSAFIATSDDYTDIATPQRSFRRPKMLWKNTRKSYKRAPICDSTSKW